MKKNIIIVLTILFLFAISFIFYNSKNRNINTKNISGNFDSESIAKIMNDFKKDCVSYSSDNLRYKNDIFDFGFNYNDNIVICERYPFNSKKDGLELNIWDKDDFESLNSVNGQKATLYIDKTVTLSPYIKGLYTQEGFIETETLINGNKMLKKEIQESTCSIPDCIYTVYKFENNKNKFLIKEYSEIDEIIKSFHGLLEEK